MCTYKVALDNSFLHSFVIRIYTERKKKRIFNLVVICIKDVLFVLMNLCLKC